MDFTNLTVGLSLFYFWLPIALYKNIIDNLYVHKEERFSDN